MTISANTVRDLHTPCTRSANLFRFLGWQGGTIHQVAETVGVSVQALLYQEPPYSDRMVSGIAVANCLPLDSRLEIGRKFKGDREFWIGVACSNPKLSEEGTI